MTSLRRTVPLVLMSLLVILPVAVMAVVGLNLLHHERERWASRAESARLTFLEQTADNIRFAVESLKSDLLTELTNISSPGNPARLRELRRTHPFVRNVFVVNPDGDLQLPPTNLTLDPETRRFVERYESLLQGRAAWFPPESDTESTKSKQSESSRILKNFRAVRSEIPEETQEARHRWLAWHWEDQNALLLYREHPDTKEITGIELEMTALFARLDVLLREEAQAGTPMVLLNRRGEPIVASREAPEGQPDSMVELGAVLPFARLGAYYPDAGLVDDSEVFFLFAMGMGGLLVLSIVSGTLGLTAWAHRSRREALRKTTFVSNVSHEFKTPLTTLRLYSELLLEDRVKDPDRKRVYLQTLRDESERLARLVHNALDFSRLEMGRAHLSSQPVNLLDKMTGVRDRLMDCTEENSGEIHIPETAPVILADPDGAEQILLNLLDNACKHTPPGTTVSVQCETSEGFAFIRVTNDGPTIPAKEQKRIFTPFYQADNRLNRTSGGTGLGLHISRRLARQMGGDLILAPDGNNTCFLWTVPLPPDKVTS